MLSEEAYIAPCRGIRYEPTDFMVSCVNDRHVHCHLLSGWPKVAATRTFIQLVMSDVAGERSTDEIAATFNQCLFNADHSSLAVGRKENDPLLKGRKH